jgi:hypothetical protein
MMEIDPHEVWVIAGLLIDEHGRTALDIAQHRAEKALTEDDAFGPATWRAVRRAAEVYLKSTPFESPHAH